MPDYIPIGVKSIKGRYGDPALAFAWMASPEAAFACALVERWGMIASIADGEDSAGRSRLRLATPEELVERALAIAELTYREIRARGWGIECPLAAEEIEP